MEQFKFELKQKVTLTVSGESGEVVARAEYCSDNHQYLVRYKAADGRGVENWWISDALEATPA